MFGGSLSGDTGFGVAFTLKDYNFLGTGDEINSSFNINSKDIYLIFLIKIIHHFLQI